MALVVPTEGLIAILDKFTGGGIGANVVIRLYQNNYTPVAGSVLASFTVANFSGYAQVTPAFGAAGIVAGNVQTDDTAARDFTVAAGGVSNTIYGYYVVDTVLGKCLWAERFASAIVMTNVGDQIELTAALTAASLF
jgi:hypothetical protein